MARIAFIQTYPYDAVLGGDGAYAQAIARGVLRANHQLHGLLTDIRRGRTSPIYKSAYDLSLFDSWNVRSALELGGRTFFSLPHKAFLQIFAGLCRKVGFDLNDASRLDWVEVEARWAADQIRSRNLDVALLFFEAVLFAPILSGRGIRSIAIPGSPILAREIRADQQIVESELAHLRADSLRKALGTANGVGFASRDDMDYGHNVLGLKNCFLVNMGFEQPRPSPLPERPAAMFVGNITPANIEAIQWALAHVWPRVVEAVPTATLRIVGRIAQVAGRTPLPQGVILVGCVDDIGAEYQRSQIVIAPLRSGTPGVKIKVAEAMTYGRPLVTTTVGVDPADRSQLDEGAIVVDDATGFADAIIELFRDSDFLRMKATGALRVFDQLFSMERSLAALYEAIAKP